MGGLQPLKINASLKAYERSIQMPQLFQSVLMTPAIALVGNDGGLIVGPHGRASMS